MPAYKAMKGQLCFFCALILFLANSLNAKTSVAQADDNATKVAKTPAGQKLDGLGENSAVAKNQPVVNWNLPAKREVIERALSDGITDPAEIVKWAKNYKVAMTIEEVRRFKTELSGKALKGYELYSWLENGTVVYSILPGTNRNKSLYEIMHPKVFLLGERFETISALKEKIGALPAGEQIVWSNALVAAKDPSKLVYPDIRWVKDLEKMATECKVKLTVSQ